MDDDHARPMSHLDRYEFGVELALPGKHRHTMAPDTCPVSAGTPPMPWATAMSGWLSSSPGRTWLPPP
jgi:hypothetical protein